MFLEFLPLRHFGVQHLVLEFGLFGGCALGGGLGGTAAGPWSSRGTFFLAFGAAAAAFFLAAVFLAAADLILAIGSEANRETDQAISERVWYVVLSGIGFR